MNELIAILAIMNVVQFIGIIYILQCGVKERDKLLNRIMARSYEDYHIADIQKEELDRAANQHEPDAILTPADLRKIQLDTDEESRRKEQLFGYDNDYSSAVIPGEN